MILVPRSKKTTVLKRLFAIKKGWLDPLTGELRLQLPDTDDGDDGDDDDDVTWQTH